MGLLPHWKAAFLYTDPATGQGVVIDLPAPLRDIRTRLVQRRYVEEALDGTRSVKTIGPAHYELIGRIRFVDAPDAVLAMLHAAANGAQLVYTEDVTDPHAKTYAAELIWDDAAIELGMDADLGKIGRGEVTVVLRSSVPWGALYAGNDVLFRYRAGEPLSAAGMTFSRASGATLIDRTGTLQGVGQNVPRIDWSHGRPALRLEPQRTNQIRNPRCEGAVVGVVGSGGALPTFWSLFSPGLAVEVVSTGTEDGMSYVDVRLAGTPTATTGALIGLDGGNHASAAAGEVWTGSLYARLVAGSLSGTLGVQIELSERDASGAVLQTHRGNIAVTDLPRLSVARHVHTATLVQAATAAVRALLRVPVTQGVPVDLTLRLAGPQLERGPYPSSLILPDVGAPAVSTRAGETVSADVSALNPPRAIAVYMRCIKGYAGDGGHSAPRLWTVSDSGDTPPRATVYVGSVGLLRFSHRTSPSVSSDAGVVGSETARGDQVEALAILLPDGSPSLAVSINGGPVLSGSSGPLAFAQAWSAARIHIAGPVSSGPLDVLDLLILRGADWTMDQIRQRFGIS